MDTKFFFFKRFKEMFKNNNIFVRLKLFFFIYIKHKRFVNIKFQRNQRNKISKFFMRIISYFGGQGTEKTSRINVTDVIT